MSKVWEGELFPKYLQWRQSQHGQTIFGIIEDLIIRERAMRPHYGMFALINDARFEYEVRTRDADNYKVSNSMAPYLAREFTANGIAPTGFLEIIGGIPDWFTRWAQTFGTPEEHVPSSGAALDLAPVPAPAIADVQPVAAPPRVYVCPGTKGKWCGRELLDLARLYPGFVSGRCPKHNRVSVKA
jgi:hypothetical protein